MHVFIKRLLFLLGVVLVLLLASFTYHRLALQRENASLNPVGQMVAVNGYKISVFVKGQGSQTLVFLSGAGTASPILDFKDVYDGFSKEYKIVVVERTDYGYSVRTRLSDPFRDTSIPSQVTSIRSIYYSFSFDGLLRDASLARKLPK